MIGGPPVRAKGVTMKSGGGLGNLLFGPSYAKATEGWRLTTPGGVGGAAALWEVGGVLIAEFGMRSSEF